MGSDGDVWTAATEVFVNFYKRHLGDIAKSCSDLSQGEMGAYDLLMDWLYANEKPLPAKPAKLYQIGRATTKVEKANVDSVIADLFVLTDSGYVQKRVMEEIENAQERAAFNREIGKLGGRPKKTQMVSENNPKGFENKTERVSKNNPSQTPVTKEQEQDQKPCPAGAGRFAQFWAAYPRHEARKQALEVWQRKRLDERADALIADVDRRKREHRPWRDGFVPHAVVYLRNERWDDAIDRSESDHKQKMAVGMVL